MVRYVWAQDGEPICRTKANEKTGVFPKVPKTDGCRPIMTLPDEFPEDIDYQRYVDEANYRLEELGFFSAPMKIKKSRRKPTLPVVSAWAVAL